TSRPSTRKARRTMGADPAHQPGLPVSFAGVSDPPAGPVSSASPDASPSAVLKGTAAMVAGSRGLSVSGTGSSVPASGAEPRSPVAGSGAGSWMISPGSTSTTSSLTSGVSMAGGGATGGTVGAPMARASSTSSMAGRSGA